MRLEKGNGVMVITRPGGDKPGGNVWRPKIDK